MIEIKLYKTPWKAVRLFVMSLPFVFVGIWLVSAHDYLSTEGLIGWVSICFSSLGLIVALFHFFDKRPQIIMNEIGIWDRTSKQDIIKWEQIHSAYFICIYRQKFISLVVDNSFIITTKQHKWASKISESVGAQKLNLGLGQINIDEQEFTEFIIKMSQAEKEERSGLIENFLNYQEQGQKIHQHPNIV